MFCFRVRASSSATLLVVFSSAGFVARSRKNLHRFSDTFTRFAARHGSRFNFSPFKCHRNRDFTFHLHFPPRLLLSHRIARLTTIRTRVLPSKPTPATYYFSVERMKFWQSDFPGFRICRSLNYSRPRCSFRTTLVGPISQLSTEIQLRRGC